MLLKLLPIIIPIILIAVAAYFSLPAILAILSFAIKLFLPFILGYAFSLLVTPLADWLQKKCKMPKSLSAVLVLIVTIGIIGSIATFAIIKIISEIRNLYQQFPVIFANAQASFQELWGKWSVIYSALPDNAQTAFTNLYNSFMEWLYSLINNSSEPIVKFAGGFAKSLPNVFISFIVFILSSFFMVSESESVSKIVKRLLLPKPLRNNLSVLTGNIKRYLGGYIKAQLTIMSIAFVIFFTGLSVLEVDYALLIAIAIAIFDALPFFGSGAILWPWAIISLFNSDFKVGIGLIIIYVAVIFTRQMIEPKIVSDKIGTPPIATLMAMYIGYKIFSIGGMIFGPVVMMLCISLYKASVFNGPITLLRAVKNWFVCKFEPVKEGTRTFIDKYDKKENKK